MPSTFQQLAAACAFAVLLPSGALASCAATAHWADLGPPAFGGFRQAQEAGGDAADCVRPALQAGGAETLDVHLSDLSLYDGVRFLTWDAAPSRITLSLAAAVLAEPDLPAPAAVPRAAAAPQPEAVALFLAGFLGVGLVALRRGRS